MLRVALATVRQDFLDDRLFDLDMRIANHWSAAKWIAARDALMARGDEFHTYDWFTSRGVRPDAVIADDATRPMVRVLQSLRVSPRRVVLLLWEPPLVRPAAWKWLRWYAPFLGVVGTCDREAAERARRFEYVPLPQPSLGARSSEELDRARQHPRTGFAVMIRSDKTSRTRGELYSLRREMVRFYERVAPSAFDLFGFGWNDASHPDPFITDLYRGEASHQLDIFPDYRFAISIDNSVAPGLITYDIFSAMQVGTVPVYLGAPDITDFVPAECFIDMRHYPTFEALHRRLRQVSDSDEWEAYREAGARYLQSGVPDLFTNQAFADHLVKMVDRVANGRTKE